jgi:hypothetical protein
MTSQMKHLKPVSLSFVVFAVGILATISVEGTRGLGSALLGFGGLTVCLLAVIFLLYYVTFSLLDRFAGRF